MGLSQEKWEALQRQVFEKGDSLTGRQLFDVLRLSLDERLFGELVEAAEG